MENYICIGGKKIERLADQGKKMKEIFVTPDSPGRKLADLEPGEPFEIGNHELVVLEHSGGETAVIYKGLLHERMKFGSNNNFDSSDVFVACEDFAGEIAEIIGAENLVEHTVDLTSDDGLDDYGTTDCFVSLLTANQYRRWVKILDKHRVSKWWWLATPHSTPAHENANWVKCVAPSGCIINGIYYNGLFGVRPFCILKSNIFVS